VERGGEWVEKERRSMGMMGAKSSGKHHYHHPPYYLTHHPHSLG